MVLFVFKENVCMECMRFFKVRLLPVIDDVGDLKKLIDSIRVSHFSDVLIMFVFSSVLVSITCDVMSANSKKKLFILYRL